MPFVKGQSGNPAGRPRGCRNKVNRGAEAELTALAPGFMGDLVAHARQGSPTAMRLVAERVMPVSRQRPVELALPALTSAADRPAAVAQITQALSEGEITIGEAAGLLRYVKEALALAPPPTAQSIDLAEQVAELREVVAQLAARLGEPGARRPANEPQQTKEEFFSAAGCPNNQENQRVVAGDGESASMRSMPESMRDQCAINDGSNAGAMQINDINEREGANKQTDAAAPADVPGPAAAPPAGEREPVNIRENTGLAANPPGAPAPPTTGRAPVNIRENTGAWFDPLRAAVLARPFTGPGLPTTLGPDVLALMQELDIACEQEAASGATSSRARAPPPNPAGGRSL